ncbi:hypothetical protein [Streptomyces sp. NPDC005970]|uniref:hypothetical protein n=1 Tax=Streptomyces sp. NPDC005970 TaxID=3156723 RepID=UPI003400E136
MFSTKSMEEYRAGAIDWLSDKSNLSSKTLRNADWQEIYETFNPDITPQWLQPNATQAPEVKAPAAETVTEYGVRILGSDSIMHVTTDEAEAKRRLAKAREIYPAATMVTRQVQATPWEVANK